MSLGEHLDTSLDSNEEIRFKQKNQALMQKIQKTIHFSYYEVQMLMIMHYKMYKMMNDKSYGVSQCNLIDIIHNGLDMTDYKLVNYIISRLEKGLANNMTMEQWGKMMSLFMRGSIEEKIRHCFSVYDTMGSDVMLRNSIIQLLKHSLIKEGSEEDDEGIKDMVDMMVKKMDIDRDGKISFEDYRQTVLKQPLLLEAFGPCTPTRLATYSFLCSFSPNLKMTR